MFVATQAENAGDKKVDPAWAWAAYTPNPQRPWNLRLAGHLYRRAAFGASWEQLKQAVAEGPGPTVDKLLRPKADVAAFNRNHDDYEIASIDPDADAGATLRDWWLRRMMSSPHPLQEKMTLFWHGHFGIGATGGGSGRLMQRHIKFLRANALGSFRTMLAGVCRDPAVLLALDCKLSHKGQPEQDFARAIVEVFCLGKGVCSAADIREAARALTGYGVLRNQFHFVELECDRGVKRILGQEGPFVGEDLVRILVEHPATSKQLVRKLFRALVSEEYEPSDELLAPLAQSLAKHYDVARVVETMLRSNLFFSPTAYRRRIKSPVEYAVGIVKGFGELAPSGQLGNYLTTLGQDIINPPTIEGWQGGRLWINRATLLGRGNLAHLLITGADYRERFQPDALARKHAGASPEAAARFLIDLFLQGDVAPELAARLMRIATAPGRAAEQAMRQLTYAILTLPESQLG